MVWLCLFVACSIKGKWRDYSLNGAQIPATLCETSNDCVLVEQFTLELDKEFIGDFRIQIGRDDNHFIYTLPATAEKIDLGWSVTVDNIDYPVITKEWLCDINGRLMVCDLDGEIFNFRRSGHP
jgi:hypothetical protein